MIEEQQIRAKDAEALLANPVFKGAVDALKASLERQAMGADPDNHEKCARIIISKQLLAGIVREVERYITEGQITDLVMLEEEKQKKSALERVFRR